MQFTVSFKSGSGDPLVRAINDCGMVDLLLARHMLGENIESVYAADSSIKAGKITVPIEESDVLKYDALLKVFENVSKVDVRIDSNESLPFQGYTSVEYEADCESIKPAAYAYTKVDKRRILLDWISVGCPTQWDGIGKDPSGVQPS